MTNHDIENLNLLRQNFEECVANQDMLNIHIETEAGTMRHSMEPDTAEIHIDCEHQWIEIEEGNFILYLNLDFENLTVDADNDSEIENSFHIKCENYEVYFDFM